MNKVVVILLMSLLTTVVLGGCGKEKAPQEEVLQEEVSQEEVSKEEALEEEVVEEAPSEETSKEETVGGETEYEMLVDSDLSETAEGNVFKVDAKKIRATYGEPMLVDKADPVLYVGVQVEITNISSEEQVISSIMMTKVEVDGTEMTPALTACIFMEEDGKTVDAELAPGASVTGWICADAREGAKKIGISVSDGMVSGELVSIETDIS